MLNKFKIIFLIFSFNFIFTASSPEKKDIDLPAELWTKIFRKLDRRSLAVMMSVNKTLADIAAEVVYMPDIKKIGPNTCLIRAARKGTLTTAQFRLLLENGADRWAKSKSSYCALCLALENGYSNAFRILIEGNRCINGVYDFPSIDTRNLSYWHSIHSKYNKNIVMQSPLLHRAIQHGYVDIVRILLDQKAALNTGDRESNSPLHYAVVHNQHEIAYLLLDHGADVNGVSYAKETPLLVALDEDKYKDFTDTQMVHLLLERRANVNFRGPVGSTALHYVIGDRDLTKLLLEYKADLKIRNNNGKTPIDCMIRIGVDPSQYLLHESAEKPESKITGIIDDDYELEGILCALL